MTRWTLPLIAILFALLSCELPGVDSPTPPPLLPQPTGEVIQTMDIPSNYVLQGYTEEDLQEDLYRSSTPTPYTDPLIVQSHSDLVKRQVIFSGEYFLYAVEQGDNFHDLARRFCGDARQYGRLLAINGMVEDDVLDVGREVMISCS